MAIATIALEPGARFTLPAVAGDVQRVLYFFAGRTLGVNGRVVPVRHAIQLAPGTAIELTGGEQACDLLLLQGRPIGEPVAQYGPFVMNTRAEIDQAFADYRRTGFGGWPWDRPDPVHAGNAERFARHASGRIEEPARSKA